MGKYTCKGHGGDGTDYGICEECFKKQLIIDRLKEENAQLKAQLRYRTKKDLQEFFGSSTPSSKKFIKSNSDEKNQKKMGGAKNGHIGKTRAIFSEKEADEIIDLKIEETQCPNCGGKLCSKGIDRRSVVDAILSEAKKIVYRSQIKECANCKTIAQKTPIILPRNKYGNELISNSIVMHYLHGIPLSRVEEIWGKNVVKGSLIKIFHRLAKFWESTAEKLEIDYRKSEVKHADETGWRTDGDNGYSWLFCTPYISIFKFENNRSSEIPKAVFGNSSEKLPGVLVVDRYAGYNQIPCDIQYCYAHLKRDLEDLEKEFPKSKEIKRFVSNVKPLLAHSMKLRTKPISNKVFYEKAEKLKTDILKNMNSPSVHCGIQKYQDIFRDNEHRLFHWVKNRSVPAENNRAERELRPTVIARKVSFGSQSIKGAKTRATLMTILHTAAKRLNNKDPSLQSWFNQTLKLWIENPEVDPYSLLPLSRE